MKIFRSVFAVIVVLLLCVSCSLMDDLDLPDVESRSVGAPILWSRMGSVSEVTNSVIGTNLTVKGSVSFVPGKFGHAALFDSAANYVSLSNLKNIMARGTISFWAAPQFDSDGNGISENHPTFISTIPWVAPPNLKIIDITYNNSSSSDHYGRIIFTIYAPVDNVAQNYRIASGRLTFGVDQWMHVAAVWDVDGIGNTTDTMRLYINGVKVGSTNSVFPLFEKTVFDVGRNASGIRSAHSKMDNIKIYDYAKTDFSLSTEDDRSKATSELLLWNRLGSTAEITNSESGSGLVVYGSPAFSAGKFGNSVLCDTTSKYISLPNIQNIMVRGSISFWFAPQFDSSGNGASDVYPTLFESTYADPPFAKQMGVYINCNTPGKIGSLYFYINGLESGLQSVDYIETSPLTFASNQWVHLAAVWDIDGIAGSSDTMRIYVDGQLKAAGHRVFELAPKTAIIFGRNNYGTRSSQCRLDNLKIYGVAKTSFDLKSEY